MAALPVLKGLSSSEAYATTANQAVGRGTGVERDARRSTGHGLSQPRPLPRLSIPIFVSALRGDNTAAQCWLDTPLDHLCKLRLVCRLLAQRPPSFRPFHTAIMSFGGQTPTIVVLREGKWDEAASV
jgi:hypothetical protein